MADTKISALSSGAPAQAGDEYVVARSGSNYKLTLTNIAASMPPIGATTPNTGAFTTLTTSSTVTLNGGTANGVLYLDGSKVATSGSALRFDGTNLGIGTVAALPVAPLSIGDGSVLQFYGVLDAFPSATSDTAAVIGRTGGGGVAPFNNAGSLIYRPRVTATAGRSSHIFYTGSPSAERLRIDESGNVGIGTSTPGSFYSEARNLVVGTGTGGQGMTIYAGTASQSRLMFADGTTGSDPYTGFVQYDHSSNALAFGTNGGTERMRIDSSGNVGIGTASPASKLDVNGIIRDSAGNVRAVPPVGTKTSSYILATGDVGKYVQVGSGGSITIPDATFAEGDVISIFNNTSGNITITCSITTAYIAGTDADKATMTLATRGVATILFISSTVCVVNGNVS